MKRILTVLVMLAGLTTAAHAMDPADMQHMTAGALLLICTDGKPDGFQMGVCAGYIAGVMNA